MIRTVSTPRLTSMAAESSTSRRLVFSPADAKTLSKLLDRVLLNVEATDHLLGELRERLSDRLSLSRWLRENISFELDALEIIDLAEAVVVGLHEHAWSDADCKALQAIANQLSTTAMPLDTAVDHTATVL